MVLSIEKVERLLWYSKEHPLVIIKCKLYISYNRNACKYFACHTPQQEVDEDCDWKEGATSAGVAAQEEDEVAEKTEQHHPHHVQPKEQVEGVKATCNCAEVLYVSR